MEQISLIHQHGLMQKSPCIFEENLDRDMCMQVCIYIRTHIHICRYNLINYSFIKIIHLKLYMPTNSLYSSALRWITKYLRDLTLLGIHIVCMLYICMCEDTHIHTHTHAYTHHIHIFNFYLLDW
jgi:hypothetical protein